MANKIMWKTSSLYDLSLAIIQIEILKETEGFYTFRRVRPSREDFNDEITRRKKGPTFHSSYEEAKEFVVKRITSRVRHIEEDLVKAKEELEKAKGLVQP